MREKAREGWEAAEGSPEYWYDPKSCKFGWGRIRFPDEGRYFYVKVPVMSAGFHDLWNRKFTGEYEYWRHLRIDLTWEYVTRRGRSTARSRIGIGSKGEICRELPKYVKLECFGYSEYTVARCKREIQANHPDRGGDPAVCQLWIERLQQARAVSA